MCFRCNYCGFHLRFENKANAKCYQAGTEHADDYSKNFASAFIGRNVKRFSVCGHFKEFIAGIEIIIESPVPVVIGKIIEESFCHNVFSIIGECGVSVAVSHKIILSFFHRKKKYYRAFFFAVAKGKFAVERFVIFPGFISFKGIGYHYVNRTTVFLGHFPRPVVKFLFFLIGENIRNIDYHCIELNVLCGGKNCRAHPEHEDYCEKD